MLFSFFFNDTATTEIYTYGHTLSLHDALPICAGRRLTCGTAPDIRCGRESPVRAFRQGLLWVEMPAWAPLANRRAPSRLDGVNNRRAGSAPDWRRRVHNCNCRLTARCEGPLYPLSTHSKQKRRRHTKAMATGEAATIVPH